jgi:hypothetical protein
LETILAFGWSSKAAVTRAAPGGQKAGAPSRHRRGDHP